MAKFIKVILIALLSLLIISCSSQERVQPVQSTEDLEEYVYHRVKYPGETYQIISSWYTKSAKNTSTIIDLNPKIKPTRIKIGDLVRIPKRMLARPKSMPKDFVDSFSASKAPKAENMGRGTQENEKTLNQELPKEEAAPAQDFSYDQNTADSYEQKVEETETKVTQEVKPETLEAPAESVELKDVADPVPTVAAAEDPNAKIREKLMKELLE